MSENRESLHGLWSGRWAFILAATGSAIGLGNIWKFPYITGENGGGAFVLIYLLCIAVIGIPIMMAEIVLGRRGRRSPINTMRLLAAEEGASPLWKYVGWSGILAGLLILSFYSVIGGWTLAYLFRTLSGMFAGMGSEEAGEVFTALITDPERLLAWHTIFIVMTFTIVSRGVRSGIEKAVSYLMPSLFVLLLVLIGYAMSSGHFQEGLRFLFQPDFSKLSADGVLVAMGQAFFTLSLGMGAIMVYGAYLPRDISITRASVTIAATDTLVALLAGMAIFPIVFANGLESNSGPGLIFQTLPLAFGHMPGGILFGSLFFVLLIFAAWTSAISLIEPMVSWMGERYNMGRVSASVWAGLTTWLLGLATLFSFNIWSDVKPLSMFEKFADSTLFDLFDYLTSNIMLPLGGLFIALFAGWKLSQASLLNELEAQQTLLFRGWYFVLRVVTPIAVVIVFLNAIGIIEPLRRLIWS